MLQYQSLKISDFSGGITDNYKENSDRKFNALDNLVIKDNTSITTRNGFTQFSIPNSSMIRDIRTIDSRIVVQNGNSISYTDNGKMIGIEKDPAITFFNAGLSTVISSSKWRNSILYRANNNSDIIMVTNMKVGGLQARIGSLPQIVSYTSTAGTRLMAVCCFRRYTDANDVQFLEYGPEKIQSSNGTAPTVISTNLKLVTAGGVCKYKALNEEVGYAVFCTEENKSTFYKVGEVLVTSTGYTGAAIANTVPVTLATDTDIYNMDQEALKREVPPCDFFTIVEGTGWYASIYDLTAKKGYRLIQSIPGMPTSVIAQAYKDLDYTITGIGSLNYQPIVLTTDAVYRIDGIINIDGTGQLRSEKVSNSEGGISHKGIVIANDEMYYCGTDGIYKTNGMTAVNITGSGLYKSYSEIIKDKSKHQNICGTFDRDTNVIYWRLSDNIIWVYSISTNSFSRFMLPSTVVIKSIASILKNRIELVANITAEVSRTAGVGYTQIVYTCTNARNCIVGSYVMFNSTAGNSIEGKLYATSAPYTITIRYYGTIPTAPETSGYLHYDSNEDIRQLLIGLDFGSILSSHKYIYGDVVPNSLQSSDPTLWSKSHIAINMLSSGINYGESSVLKWCKCITFSMRSDRMVSVIPYVIIDKNEQKKYMQIITDKSQMVPFGPGEMWGRSTAIWSPKTMITGNRHSPKGACRFWHHQIGLESAISDIYDSQSFGDGITNSSLITDTDITMSLLKNGSTVRFPYDIADSKTIVVRLKGTNNVFSDKMSITSWSQNLEKITFRRPITLAVDINDPSIELDWIVYGHQIDQNVEIVSLSSSFAFIANSEAGYNKNKSSEAQYEA